MIPVQSHSKDFKEYISENKNGINSRLLLQKTKTRSKQWSNISRKGLQSQNTTTTTPQHHEINRIYSIKNKTHKHLSF
jgi:hypothetical protein